mmetsp:Transcript_116431/g.336331  ORF Transcript_116431/g.336331 Transcript_116431/m.336331 type:complete len:273 (+) Transcript_116431:57-875(+)
MMRWRLRGNGSLFLRLAGAPQRSGRRRPLLLCDEDLDAATGANLRPRPLLVQDVAVPRGTDHGDERMHHRRGHDDGDQRSHDRWRRGRGDALWRRVLQGRPEGAGRADDHEDDPQQAYDTGNNDDSSRHHRVQNRDREGLLRGEAKGKAAECNLRVRVDGDVLDEGRETDGDAVHDLPKTPLHRVRASLVVFFGGPADQHPKYFRDCHDGRTEGEGAGVPTDANANAPQSPFEIAAPLPAAWREVPRVDHEGRREVVQGLQEVQAPQQPEVQ